MSLGSIIVGAALLVLAVAVIRQPWRRQPRRDDPRQAPIAWQTEQLADTVPQASPIADLEAQREAAYAALADLDFDRNIGKLNDDDYQRVRGQLMAQTVAVLRQLDSQAADVESQVEVLVSARRLEQASLAASGNGQPSLRCPSCGAPARAGNRYCGQCGAKLGHACPACGAAVKPGDLFCVGCGSALAAGAATA